MQRAKLFYVSSSLFLLALLLGAPNVGAQAGSTTLGGVRTGPAAGDPGVNSPALLALMDAWNDAQIPSVQAYYAADCFGFPFTPSHDYVLTRIEFFAGDPAGTVTVSMLADDGSGLPTGPVLGTVTYQETAPRRWQGADLTSPVNVHAGTLYYLRYQPVTSALATMADAGIPIPNTFSFSQCAAWDGPVTAEYPWMARFYSDMPTPALARTWGSLKITYR